MNKALSPTEKLLGPPGLRLDWPSHLELPCEDGLPVENANEQEQNAVLTSSLRPLFDRRHPDGNYFIGQDVGLYYNATQPPLEGCLAPDWYYVPGVPARLGGEIRRSYVLWRELVSPFLLIEQVSGTGADERDRTPNTGKMWLYEHVIQASYYLIFDQWRETLEGYALRRNRYARLRPNSRGHLEIAPLAIEAGLWAGRLASQNGTWLRFFNANGKLLLTSEETAQQQRRLAQQQRKRAQLERERADEEKRLAQLERERAEVATKEIERLRQQLRELGGNPDAPS